MPQKRPAKSLATKKLGQKRKSPENESNFSIIKALRAGNKPVIASNIVRIVSSIVGRSVHGHEREELIQHLTAYFLERVAPLINKALEPAQNYSYIRKALARERTAWLKKQNPSTRTISLDDYTQNREGERVSTLGSIIGTTSHGREAERRLILDKFFTAAASYFSQGGKQVEKERLVFDAVLPVILGRKKQTAVAKERKVTNAAVSVWVLHDFPHIAQKILRYGKRIRMNRKVMSA